MFGDNRNPYSQEQNSPNSMFGNNRTFEQPLQTNKWRALSLQDALSRYAPPNSRGVYYSQDGEYEYEIYTDTNGIKTYETYKRTLCSKDELPQQVSQEAFEKLTNIVKQLEAKLNDTTTNITNGSTKMSGPEKSVDNSKQPQ